MQPAAAAASLSIRRRSLYFMRRCASSRSSQAYSLISWGASFTSSVCFRGEADGTVWWTMVLLGLLALAAGIIAVVYPGVTLLALVTIIAASAIVRGAFEIYAAIRLRHEIGITLYR